MDRRRSEVLFKKKTKSTECSIYDELKWKIREKKYQNKIHIEEAIKLRLLIAITRMQTQT